LLFLTTNLAQNTPFLFVTKKTDRKCHTQIFIKLSRYLLDFKNESLKKQRRQSFRRRENRFMDRSHYGGHKGCASGDKYKRRLIIRLPPARAESVFRVRSAAFVLHSKFLSRAVCKK
jgi:hypothetical protein